MSDQELLERVTMEGGKPCVHGIEVCKVFELLAKGDSKSQVMEKMPKLDYDDIRACFAYAAKLCRG